MKVKETLGSNKELVITFENGTEQAYKRDDRTTYYAQQIVEKLRSEEDSIKAMQVSMSKMYYVIKSVLHFLYDCKVLTTDKRDDIYVMCFDTKKYDDIWDISKTVKVDEISRKSHFHFYQTLLLVSSIFASLDNTIISDVFAYITTYYISGVLLREFDIVPEGKF